MKINKGILLIFSTAVISGVSIFINKFGVKMNSPFLFAGLKNLIVGIFFIALTLGVSRFKEFRQLNRNNWLSLLAIGLIGGAIPFLLFFQ
ncbi:DMT family transporter, partial [Patescibacteria group bacterium]|nr:DMT family transporter [Patescibacteria group bacterium]